MTQLASSSGPERIPTGSVPQAEDRLRALYELSDRASRSASVEDVVEATLDAIVRTGLAERASVLLFDADDVMRFKASRGLSEAYRRSVEGHTPWRPDSSDAAPIVVPDVERDASLEGYAAVFSSEKIRSLGFFPLVHDARVLGKFMLYHATPHDFPEDEVRLAQIIAGHVSNALGRSAAERKLRVQAQVLESMVEGVSVADATGTIVYTNPSEDRIFGYERGELVGKHVTVQNAYTPEENERIVANVIQQLQERGVWEGDWLNQRKDGTPFTTHARITTLDVEGKPHFVCVQEDITQRRAAEAALHESQERFRVLADIVPAIVWMSRADGWTDFYNERWFVLTGAPRGPEGGWSWPAFLHPDDASRAETAWRESVRTGTPYEILYRFRRASDGEYRWHLGRAVPMRDASGEVVRWFGAATDVHDQKLAQEALRESEERFRQLSSSSPVGIFLALPTGAADYTNPSCDRICGFEGDALGFGWTERIHPEDKERVLAEWTTYAREPGRGDYSSEVRWQHRDGTIRHTHVRAAPLSRDGALVGHVGTVEDITEIRGAVDELARARSQLARNEKLSALGSLVAGVAHELRTPLTYLSNNLHIIELHLQRALTELAPERSAPLRERLVPCMEDAHESIARIERLVEDLRKYTKLKTGSARVVAPLESVVREAVDIFRAARRGRVHVVDELSPTPAARVDRVQVQQVVINLLENAHDANPRDATVRIGTTTSAEGWPTIVVEDRGEGIPPEVQARMWDPFYTTKPDGSGLGLSIVRRIAEEHGARLDIESRVGEGTTFRIAFPPAGDANP
ncbi:MAG TPA: PAS domain S-box protein [Candidatus Thermoplasmatota archaeon]|nr:PAS domain S-box protein [Candidatus Thermoplasmatota archaeon]